MGLRRLGPDGHKKLFTYGSIAVIITSCLTLSACKREESDDIRLIEVEKQVKSYYRTATRGTGLFIKEAFPGEFIEGFCILSAYESRVTPESETVLAVNGFLDAQGLVGDEAYWYLIIKTPKSIKLAKFDTAHTPLVSPRPAYAGKNCVIAKSIIFRVTPDSIGGSPLLGGGPKEKLFINVQPGD